MNGKELYEIYLGLRLHFTQKNYDYLSYGPKKVSLESFRKNYVLANYLTKKFPTKESLENRLIALFKNKVCWLNEIATPEAKKEELRHQADLACFWYNFENHLMMMKERFPNILDAFRVKNSFEIPPVAKMLLRKEINIETYCALDYLLDFSKHIEEAIWKAEKLKIEKYKAFFKPNKVKLAKLAKKYFV